jgi:hypothetical protein
VMFGRHLDRSGPSIYSSHVRSTPVAKMTQGADSPKPCEDVNWRTGK